MGFLYRSYDELAPEYDRRWGHYIRSSLEFGLAGIELPSDARILDVGCGTGALERRLLGTRPNLNIHGVDASGPMIAQARRTVGAPGVAWAMGDVHALPFSDEAFSHVFCFNSLHYFDEPILALAECARVLRPQGELWLMDWCDDYLACKLCSLWLRVFEPAFQRTYGIEETRRMMATAGFELREAVRGRIRQFWGMMRLWGVRR